MEIFADADACLVVRIVEKVAREHQVPVTLLCDISYVLYFNYRTVKITGVGADAVDFARIGICQKRTLL